MKIIKTTSAIIVILLFHVNLVLAQFQQTSGPEGGVVDALINYNGILLAGTKGAGIFRSTDGGNSWIQSNTGLQNLLIWAFAAKDSVVFAGTSGGMFKSTDGGVSWSFYHLSVGVSSISICGSYIFAGTTFNGIYRSEINGNTWVLKNAGLSNLNVMSMASNDSIIYIGTGEKVFISTEWGNNWTEAGLNYPVTSLAINQSMIFAGTPGGGIYKSLIASTYWSYSGSGMLLGEAIMAIKVNGGDMYAGTVYNGVYRSNNNGNTWTLISEGLVNKYVLSLECQESAIISGTYGGGIFSFDTTGNLWSPHNAGLISTSVEVFLPQGTSLYCGTMYSGLFVSDDNGSTWDFTSSGLPSAPLVSLLQSGPTLFCGTGNGQGLFQSTDQGLTWSFSGLAMNINGLTAFASKIFAGTNNGVYISFDNGNTWGNSNTGLPASTGVRAFLPDGTMLFAGLMGHGVYLSMDQGNSWAARNDGIASLYIISMIKKDSIIFVGSNAGVYRSSDNGDHWSKVVNGLGSLTINALINIADGILAGTQNGLFLSRNNGDTWINVSNGLTDLNVQAVTVIDDLVFVGTANAGVWTNSLSVLLGMSKHEHPCSFICFPNPVDDILTVKSTIPGFGFKLIQVYDHLGELVMELNNKGQDHFALDVTSLPPGLYFLRVQGERIIQSKMFLVE